MTGAFLDVAAVAEALGVSRDWVYEHSSELGAYRLGSGPKARLRFDPQKVDEWLATCSDGRESPAASDAVVTPIRRRRAQPNSGSDVVLLPIKGVAEAAWI